MFRTPRSARTRVSDCVVSSTWGEALSDLRVLTLINLPPRSMDRLPIELLEAVAVRLRPRVVLRLRALSRQMRINATPLYESLHFCRRNLARKSRVNKRKRPSGRLQCHKDMISIATDRVHLVPVSFLVALIESERATSLPYLRSIFTCKGGASPFPHFVGEPHEVYIKATCAAFGPMVGAEGDGQLWFVHAKCIAAVCLKRRDLHCLRLMLNAVNDHKTVRQQLVDWMVVEAAIQGIDDVFRFLIEEVKIKGPICPQTVKLVAISGSIGIMRLMIEAADDIPFDSGRCLQLAARQGHLNVVELLLAAQGIGIDIAVDGGKALIEASRRGKSDVVALLLRNEFVNPAAEDNMAIKVAAFKGHSRIVGQLLDRGGGVKATVGRNIVLRDLVSFASSEDHWIIRRLLAIPGVNPRANKNDALKRAKTRADGAFVGILEARIAELNAEKPK